MSTRIFVVEDDENFKKLLELRLRAWRGDIDFISADTITSAKQKLDNETSPFLLAVLDQHLPDGFGSELADHPKLQEAAVLAVSADLAPELPGRSVQAGAQHFLMKRQVSEALFIPLIEALIQRKLLERTLIDIRLKEYRMETIKVLLSTLRHEINNPLGAVFGAAYLFKTQSQLDDNQRKALTLIESSSNRIKHVVEQLCEAVELAEVNKGGEKVFHVPGDPPWGSK